MRAVSTFHKDIIHSDTWDNVLATIACWSWSKSFMAGHFGHAQGTDTSIYLISTNADLYNPMVHKSPNVCLGLKSKPFAWTNSGFYFRLCFLCYHEGRLFRLSGIPRNCRFKIMTCMLILWLLMLLSKPGDNDGDCHVWLSKQHAHFMSFWEYIPVLLHWPLGPD